LVAELAETHGIDVHRGTVWRVLRGLGLTHKNVWPAPLASRLRLALTGRALTYPA
jgi:hypothetical protein